MSLVTWFKGRSPTSPRVESLVRSVADYLAIRPNIDEFRPNIVAAALNESELAAMTALSILQDRGITKQYFGIYCRNSGVPLESYTDLSDLSEGWYCTVCDDTHERSEPNDYRVETYFTVDRSKLATFIAGQSAA